MKQGPDFMWQIGDDRFVVDVVTIFDEKEIEEESAALQQLLRHILASSDRA